MEKDKEIGKEEENIKKEEKKEEKVNEEKEPIEKKSKKPKKSKTKKIILFSIIGLFIITGVIVAVLLLSNHDSSCHKIAKKISENLNNATIVDAGEDSKHNYSYIDSSEIYTNEVGSQSSGKYAIAVLKYNSNEEAQANANYYKELYEAVHKKIEGTLLEKADDLDYYLGGENDLIIVKGIYFIRINSYYKEKYDNLESKINDILKDYDIEDINNENSKNAKNYWDKQIEKTELEITNTYNQLIEQFKKTIDEFITQLEICEGKTCDEYLNEALKYKDYPDIADGIQSIQDKYNEVINRKKELANTISNNITNVESSLNQNEYDSIKNQINEIKDSFYDDYKKEWENRLNAIDERVFKKSCSSLNYKDVLRDPDTYKGKTSYWFGEVQQKVSDTQYRIGVDCEKYRYIDGYSCKNTIYVFYYGNTKIIEDDIVKVYGTMDGTVTYETVMGASVTIPKVSAKYIDLQ